MIFYEIEYIPEDAGEKPHIAQIYLDNLENLANQIGETIKSDYCLK